MMDPNTLRFIQDNAPDASEEDIKKAFQDTKENVLDTISLLLDIPKPKTPVLTGWAERREIFDSYDREMQNLLNSMRNPPKEEKKEAPTITQKPSKKIFMNPNISFQNK